MVSRRAGTIHRLTTIYAALDGAASSADEDDEDVSSEENVDLL